MIYCLGMLHFVFYLSMFSVSLLSCMMMYKQLNTLILLINSIETFQDGKKLLSHPSFRQCSLDNDWEAGLGGLGSLDSSDLILASQGSLAGLELLAMRGSMRPNGSISNSVYVNPFNPLSRNTSRGHKKHRQKLASRSRSNDLGSDLEFGSSVDNLELHHRFRKSRQHQV